MAGVIAFGQPALELSGGPRIVRTWRAVTPAVFSVQVSVSQRLLRHRHRRLLSTGRRAVEQHSPGRAPVPLADSSISSARR